MKYKAVNEIEHFNFRDAQIDSIHVEQAEQTITFALHAVIVTPQNTQNENFTYSYAGDLSMTLYGADIQVALQEGYKYYDANDVLIEEVPDTELSKPELSALLQNLSGAYLWNMTKVEESQNQTGHELYLIGIDLGDEENTTYWLQVAFDEIVMEWDRYMNRVEM